MCILNRVIRQQRPFSIWFTIIQHKDWSEWFICFQIDCSFPFSFLEGMSYLMDLCNLTKIKWSAYNYKKYFCRTVQPLQLHGSYSYQKPAFFSLSRFSPISWGVQSGLMKCVDRSLMLVVLSFRPHSLSAAHSVEDFLMKKNATSMTDSHLPFSYYSTTQQITCTPSVIAHFIH